MEKYSRFLLLAVFILGLLALSGKGVSGQPSATVSENNNTAFTSNTAGAQDSQSNSTTSTSSADDTDTPGDVIPDAADATSENTPAWDIPAEGAATDDTLVEETPIEGTTTEDTPTEEPPTGHAPSDDTYTDDTPAGYAPTEGAEIGDTQPVGSPTDEGEFPGDVPTEPPTEESPLAGIPTEGTPPADGDAADSDSTGLVFAPTDVNDTETEVGDLGEDAPSVDANITTEDSAVEDTADDVMNATGFSDTTTTGFSDTTTTGFSDTTTTGFSDTTTTDDGDDYTTTTDDGDDYWDEEDEWDVTSDGDTMVATSPDDVTTAASEDNTTSSDMESTTETHPIDYDGDDYHDEDYEDYEEVNGEDPDITSANVTDISTPDDDDSFPATIDDSDADAPLNDTSVDDVTSPNVTPSDDSAPPIDTDESGHQAPEKADFVVYNSLGKPCLLASLNITIHFKYHVQEGLVRETYETVSKKNTQDGSRYWGMCEDTMSKLSITWNNDTFTLNLTFTLKDKNDDYSNEIDMDVLPPGVNSSDHSWSLQEVSLSYNTGSEDMFPGAYNPTVESVMAEDLNLFRTPLAMSYMCKVPEVVTVEFKDVDLAFNYMHLMPFGVQSQFFSNETVECSGDMSSVPGKDESYTVPLIVAGVLAGIVVAILVVYATVRCVTRRVRQGDYKQME